MRRVLAVLTSTGAAIVCVASCLQPTQVRVKVTTDVCELADVKIFRNADEVASTKPTRACVHVGTLVFVPSGNGDRFVVKVQGMLPGGNCNPGSPTCVTALRTVSFQSHASFELPIALSRSCVGVVCDPGKTCDQGQCVPIPSTCRNPPCDVEDASMPDVAVVDAPLDTNIVVDAGMDGGMTCGGQWKSPFSYGSLLHAWNFDEGASPIKDSVGLKTMLVPGYSFVQSDNKACKWALTLDGMNQAATQATAGVGISASMVVNVPANQAGVPILYGLGATYGGWSIAFVNNGNGTVSPEITIDHTIQQSATSGHKIPTDGSSHLLEITMAGTTAAFAVDGSAVETVSTQVGIADDQALFFGTSSKIVIDELRIYKGATW